MGTGATGYYTLKIPFATLQKFDKEGRADTATGCHYYYFRFAREHSYTLVRLPEEVILYLFFFNFIFCHFNFLFLFFPDVIIQRVTLLSPDIMDVKKFI